MVRARWRLLILCALICLGAPVPLFAQTAQAEMWGTVFDEQGAVLPGATITARHVETGTSRTVVSSENGSFRMPALPVGIYVIEVELQGFAKMVREGLTLAVGQTAQIDFRLKLASVSETITVAAESPLVETRKSDISGRIDPKQIESLPIVSRDWLALVALVPGARGNIGAIVSGASGSDMAKYQVDGVDVTNQCCGGTYMSYSQENLAEFQVLTNRFDAEYGRVGGTVINAVTKSGTNQFKGSFFGFFRNDRFDSKNDLMKELNATKRDFNQRQVGVTLGGPVIKDKMHFFGTFENHLLAQDTFPATRIAKFDNPYPANTTRRIWTLRLDWQLNQNHRLFARTSKNDRDFENSGIGGRSLWSQGYSWPSRNNDLSVGGTWVMSDRAVHEFRIGFMRDVDRLVSNIEMPLYSFPSLVVGSPTNSPQSWKEFNLEVKNSFSYFVPDWHGQHALKMGFQFFRPRFWGSLPDKAFGSFNFAQDPPNWDGLDKDGRVVSMANWPAPTSFTQPLGDFTYDVINPIYGGFVQDNWTVTSRLTLNLGVRYDIETGVKNPDLVNVIDPRPRVMDRDNVQVRLGFAYDMFGDGRTIVRGGFGDYYDKVMLNITGNELRQANKKSVTATIINPTSLTNPLGGLGYSDFVNLPTSTTVLANDYKTPRETQYSIGLAKQIGTHYAFQVDYVHIRGRDEPRARNINLFSTNDIAALRALNLAKVLPANPTRYGRPRPEWVNITQYETTAKSKYDGLQVGATKRMSHRFQFQATYTLSSTWNDHEGNRFAGVTNPFDLADEWAHAASDQRHRFVTNWIVQLPYQFTASTILFVGSPRVASPSTSRDPFRSGTGRWLETADFVGGQFVATGATVARNSLRMPKWDVKLDLRIAKTLRVTSRIEVQGIAEVYNLTNRSNVGSIGTNYFATNYKQAQWSTGDTYQPRQVQFGFRFLF